MTIDECITILTEHNKWRRGADTPMGDVKVLGKAIDYAIQALQRNAYLEKQLVIDSTDDDPLTYISYADLKAENEAMEELIAKLMKRDGSPMTPETNKLNSKE